MIAVGSHDREIVIMEARPLKLSRSFLGMIHLARVRIFAFQDLLLRLQQHIFNCAAGHFPRLSWT